VRRGDLLLSILRLGFAAAGVAAISYQASALKAAHVFRPGNFFSFFTIQSNILSITVLAAAALVRRSERSPTFEIARAAATIYMAITGVVFAVLLTGVQENLDTHIAWVNDTVHTILPIVLVADWLIDPPRHRFRPRVIAFWIAYPVAWFAYTLLRGPHAHWYPYPFVDVSEHGYGRVLLNGVGLVVFFTAVAAVFLIVGQMRVRAARHSTQPGSEELAQGTT
jgi:hypothetical protein